MQLGSKILLHALPFFVLLIFAEAAYVVKEHRQNKFDFLSSLALGLGGIPSLFLINGLIIYTYSSLYQFRFFILPSSLWYVWLIGFFGDDFSYYWFHRLSHSVRFLWASHQVHHSSQSFTLATAVRVPWTSNLTGAFLFWAWMPLIGLEPQVVIFFKSISVIYQFWLHTEKIKKMPKWFEAFFNTPSHHRVHHGIDVEYLDKNHGGNLIIWDKIFGTFLNEQHQPVYGLTKNITSFNPIIIAFHEWLNIFKDLRKGKSITECLHYFFDSPGWSKDGSTKTTKQLRKEIKLVDSECEHSIVRLPRKQLGKPNQI